MIVPGERTEMTCPKCGTSFQISSGINPDLLVCPRCGWTPASSRSATPFENKLSEKAMASAPARRTPNDTNPTSVNIPDTPRSAPPSTGTTTDVDQPKRTVPAVPKGKTGPIDREIPNNET
jgi:hypothetical protein